MLKFLPKLRSSVGRVAGFTMIELLIVITILGILAVAVLSAINPLEQINRGRDTSSQSDAEQLLNAIERFNAFQAHFPWDASRSDSTVDGGVQFILAATAAIDAADPWLVVDDANNAISGNPECAVLDRLGPGDDTLTSSTCLTGANEVKPSFITRIAGQGVLRGLYVYKQDETPQTSLYVCFAPQSAAFLEQARQRCATPATLPADFPVDEACNVAATAQLDGMGNPTTLPMICLP